jgi:tetratricopeptide (TPR) repeat protein
MLRAYRSAACVGLVLAVAAATAWAQEQKAGKRVDVEMLVDQLADERFGVRERAMRALIEVGEEALPALERAAKSDDAEVASRARRAIRAISYLEPAKQARLRQQGQQALRAGDNEVMVKAYRRLSKAQNASLDDRRWLGHAHQLGGRWKEAAEAYAAALERIDQRLDGKEEDDDAGAAPRPATQNRPVQRQDLVRQRAALIVMLGRIRGKLLDDPQAAAATYPLAARNSDELTRPLEKLAETWKSMLHDAYITAEPGATPRLPNHYDEDLHYPLLALRELAAVQERLGRNTKALQTWQRIRLVSQCFHRGRDEDDLVAVDRLLRKQEIAPNDAPFGVLLVGEEEPTVSLDLEDVESLAKAYRNDGDYWTFCLAPPAGKEFATLQVDCDIQQLERRYGGQFRCWAMVGDEDARRMEIGSIGWPSDEKLGRSVQSKTFQIEPGTGAVHFRTGSWDGKFHTHGVKVTATFRERSEDRAAAPVIGFVIQNECLPEGGELMLDDRPYRTGVASHGVRPGRHIYRYTHPHREKAQTQAGKFQAGARYGLFINLDSPLESRLTNLRGITGNYGGKSRLVRQKDGTWLAAWQAEGGTLHFATSDDLVKWSKPWALAESGLYGDRFACISPSLYADGDGTLWLAYFSNRLDLEKLNTGGYRLFLAHSRDGRRWSTPRPLTSSTDGWPPGSVQMTKGPDGKFWMFHRLMAATADSPAEVRGLVPLPIAGDDSLAGHARHPHATFTDEGRVHLVWDHFGQKLMYARRSKEGGWSPAVELTRAGQNAAASRPRLLVQGERVVLLHEKSGAWLRPGRITKAGLELGEPVKISDHVAPLSGLYLPSDADGTVAALCGEDTVWVRTVAREELFEKLATD